MGESLVEFLPPFNNNNGTILIDGKFDSFTSFDFAAADNECNLHGFVALAVAES